MKGKIDMNAVTGEADAPRFSDAGISGFLEQDTEVLITAAKKNYIKNKTRRCFSPVSKKTMYDLGKHGVFKAGDRNSYKHNCLCLALQAGGLPAIQSQK